MGEWEYLSTINCRLCHVNKIIITKCHSIREGPWRLYWWINTERGRVRSEVLTHNPCEVKDSELGLQQLTFVTFNKCCPFSEINYPFTYVPYSTSTTVTTRRWALSTSSLKVVLNYITSSLSLTCILSHDKKHHIYLHHCIGHLEYHELFVAISWFCFQYL